MHYQWAYPDTDFLVCPVNICPVDFDITNDKIITKNNWFNVSVGMERVMTELQKCGEYFKEAVPVYVK